MEHPRRATLPAISIFRCISFFRTCERIGRASFARWRKTNTRGSVFGYLHLDLVEPDRVAGEDELLGGNALPSCSKKLRRPDLAAAAHEATNSPLKPVSAQAT
jgi:hypothetical protein